MKKLIIILLLVACQLSLFSQEKHPYVYGHNNGSMKFDIIGYNGPMRLEIRDGNDVCNTDPYKNGGYYKCYGPLLSVAYDKATDGNLDARITVYVFDIPAGLYTFNVRYAPKGLDVWRYGGSKAKKSEIIGDSKFICINTLENEK